VTIKPGDMVKMRDWDESQKMVVGRLVTSVVRGKVWRVINGNVYLWTDTYAGMWSGCRVLPLDRLLPPDTATRKAAALERRKNG
jgi:hypothetical protein